ncbi:hypothetical protein SAMN04489712_11713 [Thermomonospora echinospora]|uniref:DUF885 domain-containing protein n=1 Tax=Thermomonospora echinospora TaxID=1992 RepID=A0A1H6DH34_9ACTN|nr:hypothetical protein [Thermomonospora echinospora]SEG84491.1 hypothetical protein SAMN04489712_11713 [Thermomonospora echinospora]
MTPQEWLRGYALLALRVNRRLVGDEGATVLIYRGPQEWSAQVKAEEPAAPGRLADDAEALLDEPPFEPERARYLRAQVRALRTVARRLAGERLPLPEYAHQCLGIQAHWLPQEVFEEAHARLDRALPRGTGALTERLQAWQAAHTLPLERLDLLPALVDRAVAEARRRTAALVPLPDDEVVDCRLRHGAHFLAAGHYAGERRSTIFINGDLPFNLADLLYVVTHEGHPGHIAESMLKELVLVEEQGRLDQQVRFMLGPSFVISEGLGLHAQDIAFPGDEAQAWLTDNVLAEHGMTPDSSDFAAIHRARNALFGAWANAGFLAAEGRPDHEVTGYLSRWALMSDAEAAAALGSLRAPGMELYTLGYYHGWRLLNTWLDSPDRTTRVRRLLTEQLLPSDLKS